MSFTGSTSVKSLTSQILLSVKTWRAYPTKLLSNKTILLYTTKYKTTKLYILCQLSLNASQILFFCFYIQSVYSPLLNPYTMAGQSSCMHVICLCGGLLLSMGNRDLPFGMWMWGLLLGMGIRGLLLSMCSPHKCGSPLRHWQYEPGSLQVKISVCGKARSV